MVAIADKTDKAVKKTSKRKSLDWLVASRGYAMFLVYFGHVVVTYLGDKSLDQLVVVGTYIEPVLVPFFALIVGAFYVPTKQGFKEFAKLRFMQRMYPVYFYLLLVIPFCIFFPHDNKSSLEMLAPIVTYLVGIPFLSWSSWFLVALFVAELMYFFIYPHTKKPIKAIVIALLFYSGVWWFNHIAYGLPNLVVAVSYAWMFQAAVLFVALFIVGVFLKPYIKEMTNWPMSKTFLVFVVSLALLIVAALNNSFVLPPEGHVKARFPTGMPVVAGGIYGNYFYFMMCVIFGPIVILTASRLLPVTNFFKQVGEESLVLLGLNGIFLSVMNRHIANVIELDNNVWPTAAICMLISTAQLMICLPVAKWCSKKLPQLTGKPMLEGPILPALYKKK